MIEVPYAIGLLSAFGANLKGGSAWMLLPVVGPFVASFSVGCGFVSPPADCNSPLYEELLWFDSFVQVSGAALLTWGLIGRWEWIPNDVSAWLVPTLSPGGAGLRVKGSF
jgi:hypothetical protein